MAISRESWLYKNDGRNYPIVDQADRPETVPTNLVVDLHIGVPSSISDRLFFSAITVNNAIAAVTISGESYGPMFRLSVTNPESYRNYALTPVDAGFSGHGFICLGSAADTGTNPGSSSALTLDQAEILPSLITRTPSLPYAYAGAGSSQLKGDVPIEGEKGVVVEVEAVAIPQPDGSTLPRRAIVISLEEDLETMEKPLRECQIPLEAGVIPETEDQPILSLNGVLPDASGAIYLELEVEEFTWVDDYGVEHTDRLVELAGSGTSNVLRIKSKADVTDLCGTTKNRTIYYTKPGCQTTGVEINEQSRLNLGAAFIHRQYLVLYWAYGGNKGVQAANPIGGVPIGTITVQGSREVTRRTENGVATDYAYDVDAQCNPQSTGREQVAARTIVTLEDVFRNTGCEVVVGLASNIVEEVSLGAVPINPLFKARSSAVTLQRIHIRDPFLFDGSYMTSADQQAIEQEIQDYLSGSAPWGGP